MNGVTRQNIINLCRINAIPVFERNFSLFDTYSADEAFLTGTFGAQTPVASLDGVRIGVHDGAGPVTRQLRRLYAGLVKKNVS